MRIHKRFSMFVMPLVATAALTVGIASPAVAASPTDRLTLVGTSSDGTKVIMHVFTLSGHDHTWGEVDWPYHIEGCVWEDQTTDPTLQTIWGPEREACDEAETATVDGYRIVTTGSYTSPLYDGPGYYVRVCGDNMSGVVICTKWN